MHDTNDTNACIPTEKTGRLMADALRNIADAFTARLDRTPAETARIAQARAALAAYDRAQRPKPKGAPGRCPVCRHYGEDCTCYRRKGARRGRS